MKYIAFDIEAANGYKPYSICSIGIVVADEQFNIVKRTNLWINPKTSYNLNGTRANVGIDLHLDKKLLDRSPTFSERYKEICSYLADEDAVIIGHAVDSDVRMLNSACDRYRLPRIKFNFVCTQLLYRLLNGEKEVKALFKIANELQLVYEPHNSEEDAWMSMMTLKHIVGSTGKTLEQLLSQYFIRVGVNRKDDFDRCVSMMGSNTKTLSKRASNAIRQCCEGVPVVDDSMVGVYAFARTLELLDTRLVGEVMANLTTRGGTYTSRLKSCTHYVTCDNVEKQDKLRNDSACKSAESGNIIIVDIKKLCEKIGVYHE